VGLLSAEAAARADDREQCASAADQGQQLRDEGKYRRAREQLLVCARDACPPPIRRDCADWLAQLETTAPTVVFSAKDGPRDIAEVMVWVDGVALTERLDGKPVPMDLGKHTVRFEYQGRSKEEDVVIGAGQKNRSVSVDFAVTPVAAEAPAPRPVPSPAASARPKEGSLVPSVVVGSVGVVALGAFVFFGVSGKSDVSGMESSCKPNCAESDVSAARTKLLVADISLGVGVVALGVATYLLFTRAKVDAAVRAGAAPRIGAPPAATGLTLGLGATPGGGFGSVGARF
jgi:hypothetical protein